MSTTSRGPAGRKRPSSPRRSSRPSGSGGSRGSAGRSDDASTTTSSDDGSSGSSSRRSSSRRSSGSSRAPTLEGSTASATAEERVRSSVTTRAAVLLGVLAILAVSYALPVRAWLDQRALLDQVSDQRDSLAAEVESLRADRELWNDPAFVRAQARERLNFVLPGEVGLVVLGTEATPPEEPVSGTVLPATSTSQPWWATLASAFREVGKAEATAAAQGSDRTADAGEAADGGVAADPGEAGDSGEAANAETDAGTSSSP